MKIIIVALALVLFKPVAFGQEKNQLKDEFVEFLAFRSFAQALKIYEVSNKNDRHLAMGFNINMSFTVYCLFINDNEVVPKHLESGILFLHQELLKIDDPKSLAYYEDPMLWKKNEKPKLGSFQDILTFETHEEYMEMVKKFNKYLDSN